MPKYLVQLMSNGKLHDVLTFDTRDDFTEEEWVKLSVPAQINYFQKKRNNFLIKECNYTYTELTDDKVQEPNKTEVQKQFEYPFLDALISDYQDLRDDLNEQYQRANDLQEQLEYITVVAKASQEQSRSLIDKVEALIKERDELRQRLTMLESGNFKSVQQRPFDSSAQDALDYKKHLSIGIKRVIEQVHEETNLQIINGQHGYYWAMQDGSYGEPRPTQLEALIDFINAYTLD